MTHPRYLEDLLLISSLILAIPANWFVVEFTEIMLYAIDYICTAAEVFCCCVQMTQDTSMSAVSIEFPLILGDTTHMGALCLRWKRREY